MADLAPALTGELDGSVVAGRYRIVDMLGRGGFGAVYHARDLHEGRDVAVKAFSRAEGLAPRAVREARTAAKLEHPNIQTVLGVEHDECHAYLVSELVVGERFDRTALGDEEKVRAIAAVADALAHAHARAIVHRDVKPANILVSIDGDVTLTDFGIAHDGDADQTLDEQVLGTLSYMAPEQASGEAATGKADVWAAALTLYEALAGTNPFRARSLGELMDRLQSDAPPLERVRPDLPRPLCRAIAAGLRRDPRSRPSAEGFRDGLLAALRPEQEDEARTRRIPELSPRVAHLGARAGAALLAGAALVWTLGAFPVYPAGWTLPLALVVALTASWSPRLGAALGALVCVPAFWNYAEAAGLTFALLATAWIWHSRHAGVRCLAPLLAGPLAALSVGPAFVLVAATAPGGRRRAAEGAVGATVAVVCGGLVPARDLRGLPGASSPTELAVVLARSPAVLATVAAVAAFSVLLPYVWRFEPPRRRHALVAWGFAFALAVTPLALFAGALAAWPAAAVAAVLAGIIPAAWSVAAPGPLGIR